MAHSGDIEGVGYVHDEAGNIFSPSMGKSLLQPLHDPFRAVLHRIAFAFQNRSIAEVNALKPAISAAEKLLRSPLLNIAKR